MNEDQIEDMLNEVQQRHMDKVRECIEDAMSASYTDILPYVVQDTVANATIQAQDIVLKIASGEFKRGGDYLLVNHPRGDYTARIRVKMTDYDYDNLRDNLIRSMPECPKDAKIKSLENEIERLWEFR